MPDKEALIVLRAGRRETNGGGPRGLGRREGFKVGTAGLGEALAASGEERLGPARALQVGGDGAL
jgi:hypothetical protein